MALGAQPTNFLVNGDMSIAQKGSAVTGIGWFAWPYRVYTTDMWQICQSVKSAVVTDEQVTDHPILGENGFSKKITVTTAKKKLMKGDCLFACQLIEAEDCRQFLSRTAAAYVPFVISGWLKAKPAGTYSVNYTNTNGQSFIFPVAVPLADTWTYFEQPVVANGYVDRATETGVLRIFAAAASGMQLPPANAGVWSGNAGSNGVSALKMPQANICAAVDNYLQLTDMRLEIGYFATPYIREPFHDRLSRCQRYYWQTFDYGETPTQNSTNRATAFCYTAAAGGASEHYMTVIYPCSMAVPPIVTGYNVGGGAGSLPGYWHNAGPGISGPGMDSGAFRVPPPGNRGVSSCRICNLQAPSDGAGDVMMIHITCDASWWL